MTLEVSALLRLEKLPEFLRAVEFLRLSDRNLFESAIRGQGTDLIIRFTVAVPPERPMP